MEGINGKVDFNIMYAEIENNIALTGNPYNEPTYNHDKGKSSMAKEYVKWLQYELNQLGYNLKIDGYFGTLTENALLDTQNRLGLKVDGVCGQLTREALKK